MPKKFKGENSKAAEARARKEAQRQEEADKKQRELEDEFWKDDDKHAAKKQQRKEDKEKKRQDVLERKKEAQRLLDEEQAAIKAAKPAPSDKVTRAEIEAHKARQAATGAAASAEPQLMHDELPLEENVNILQGAEGEARSVTEALEVLSTKDPELDKHPEKRVKAAYTKYEEINLPKLKAENPNMRLSQLKQMLKKDWQKSPENPLNQRFQAYNIK